MSLLIYISLASQKWDFFLLSSIVIGLSPKIQYRYLVSAFLPFCHLVLASDNYQLKLRDVNCHSTAAPLCKVQVGSAHTAHCTVLYSLFYSCLCIIFVSVMCGYECVFIFIVSFLLFYFLFFYCYCIIINCW